MNVASNNWTVTPADFEAARRQWEYSHAVSAVLGWWPSPLPWSPAAMASSVGDNP